MRRLYDTHLPAVARERQAPAAALLFVTSTAHGVKDARVEDYYFGHARRDQAGVVEPPYDARIMTGIEVATRLGWFAQAHLDLLDGAALARWYKAHPLQLEPRQRGPRGQAGRLGRLTRRKR